MLAENEHLKSLPIDPALQLIDELPMDDEDAPELSEAIVQDALDRIAAMKADPTLGISLEELWKRVDAARR